MKTRKNNPHAILHFMPRWIGNTILIITFVCWAVVRIDIAMAPDPVRVTLSDKY